MKDFDINVQCLRSFLGSVRLFSRALVLSLTKVIKSSGFNCIHLICNLQQRNKLCIYFLIFLLLETSLVRMAPHNWRGTFFGTWIIIIMAVGQIINALPFTLIPGEYQWQMTDFLDPAQVALYYEWVVGSIFLFRNFRILIPVYKRV